jgi:hypothetical protein
MERPTTPKRLVTASQMETPPESQRKLIKIPKGDLSIVPVPPTPCRGLTIVPYVKKPLQVRRKDKAMKKQGHQTESPPFYSKVGVDGPESESARLRRVGLDKEFDKWMRQDQQVSPNPMPDNEAINVALNPFWLGEEEDGPYYPWLNDIFVSNFRAETTFHFFNIHLLRSEVLLNSF